MPILTPENAKMPMELPSSSLDDTGIFLIAQTHAGVKKMPLSQLQDPSPFMIGSVLSYFGNDANMATYSVPLLGGGSQSYSLCGCLKNFKISHSSNLDFR